MPRLFQSVAVATVLLTAACGARTPLLEPPDRDAAVASDTPTAGDSAVPPADSSCPSALAPGAPTPIAQYCSTRDNAASVSVSAHPRVLAATHIGGTLEPSEMVVAADGRVYLTIDTQPDDDAVIPHTLAALEPDGSIAWAQTFDEAVSGTFLAWDGTLRVRRYGATSTLASFDRDGNLLGHIALPDNELYPAAVDSHRNMYMVRSNFNDPATIVKLAPLGSTEWESSPVGVYPAYPLALTRADRVVLSSYLGDNRSRVIQLDERGQIAWQNDYDGYIEAGPAVGRDGRILFTLSVDNFDHGFLVALDDSGRELWRTDLQARGANGRDPLVIDAAGTAYARAADAVVAVDSAGSVRWHFAIGESLAYSAAVDSAGTLVIVSGSLLGVSTATGAMLWSVQPPNGSFFANAFALGPAHRLYVGAFDGRVFTLGD